MSGNRKSTEKNWYDSFYSSSNGVGRVRNTILWRSDAYFKARICELVGPGKRVLEIGCGTGDLSILCAKSGATVVGVDISENAINIARQKAQEANSNASFEVGDIENLPFENRSFDLVLDREVLSSTMLDQVLRECSRVLSDDGVFLGIECYGHNPLFNFNRSVKAVLGTRTAWAVRHILNRGGVACFRENFREVDVTPFHLSSAIFGLPAIFLPAPVSKLYITTLEKIDNYLFKSNSFREMAFKMVVEARAKTRDGITS